MRESGILTRFRTLTAAAAAAGIILVATGTAAAGPTIISRISTDSSGVQSAGANGSYYSAISSDGRYVVFDSDATDLVAAHQYGFVDIYRKDTQTGATILVSAKQDGTEGLGHSRYPSVSSDGRYVVFESTAPDLVADSNGFDDIFRKDTQTGALVRVSVPDPSTGQSEADGPSYNPSISGDGRYVVFESEATNLVAGDTAGFSDIFVRDLQAGTTRRVSVTNGTGSQANGSSYDPDIDGYGRFIVFESAATNLTGASDTNGAASDIFIRDMQPGTPVVSMVSADSGGLQGSGASVNPSIAPDAGSASSGAFVAFQSDASDLADSDGNGVTDVFLKSVSSGALYRVSTSVAGVEGNGASSQPDISNSGHFVAFRSLAGNLVAGDSNGAPDMFVKDFYTGVTELVSVDPGGAQAAGGSTSDNPALDASGRYLAFGSTAANLVGGDTNAVSDIFMTRSGPEVSFTWYDAVGSGNNNWILLANTGGSSTAWFDLAIGGSQKSLAPFALSGEGCPGGSCAEGEVPAGRIIYPVFPGLQTGPVDIGYHSQEDVLVSQRILWEGVSLEEVLATDSRRLSNRFFWTWYDMSPGYQNWVLISNPNATPVYYEVRLAGDPKASGTLGPGGMVTPFFNGWQGGPLEVRAWTDASKTVDADVMASQRVLIGKAFNEVPGIPETELSDHYLWTWYDQVSPGSANYVMVANPTGSPITYGVRIGGVDMINPDTGTTVFTVPANGTDPQVFEGVQNGPVELIAAAPVIASQRVVWGPSFEEVPGYPAGNLASTYHWTWYDWLSEGSSNWVMIAPDPAITQPVRADISYTEENGTTRTGSCVVDSDAPDAGDRRCFWSDPGYRGGPVKVTAVLNSTSTPANVIVSQRVLWGGYFNEVLGTPAS